MLLKENKAFLFCEEVTPGSAYLKAAYSVCIYWDVLGFNIFKILMQNKLSSDAFLAMKLSETQLTIRK